MIQLDRLAQIIEEDRQSRNGIREEVEKDIKGSINKDLLVIYQRTINAIETWIAEDCPFPKKQIRKTHLKTLTPEEIAIELFVAIAINNNTRPIQEVASKISIHLNYTDPWDAALTASELIGVCVNTGLYDITATGSSILVQSLIQLEPETKSFINKTQYPNPLICKPDDWKNNRQGGYLTICDYVVLGRENKNGQQQALDAINTIQNIEWELDPYILEFFEEPNKELESREQKEAHKLMVDTSHEIYEDLLNFNNNFYFQWQYDFRGRMYSSGYYVNLQSTSYKKALLNFANKKLII